jgi:molecular chaperone HtpG
MAASSDTAGGQTYVFQAEINQLLSLIIGSFYSNKDVFLRELVSNAVDALDKQRHSSLVHGTPHPGLELCVRVRGDADARTLVVEDSGVGMTEADLVKNLGTIAHSGTRAFMEALKEGKADVSLIGQFGVGFYSAFLVADRVTVYSKHDDSPAAYRWDSDAGGTFTVAAADAGADPLAADLPRGTRVVLRLKDDMADYASEGKVREIIKTHSQYAGYPIYVLAKRTREEEEEEEVRAAADDAAKEGEGEGEGEVDDISVSKDEKKKRKRTVVYHEYDHVNKIKPVWQRRPDEVDDADHEALFKSLSNDWQPPLGVKHFEADGQVQFKAVLYVPRNSPVDLFQTTMKKKRNVRLYVKRVFVSDMADDLVPDYLNFVHGIVDSDDLPLNVSREMLQQNRIMKTIKKTVVKRCLDMFGELAEDPEKYRTFYQKFSKNIKLGVHEDAANRERLAGLLRFHSTADGPGAQAPTVSLADYATRMKEGQDRIYFLTAESLAAARKSPCIERLVAGGHEVLLMVDPMDEYVMQVLHEHAGKKFACCSRAGLVMPGDEEEKHDPASEMPGMPGAEAALDARNGEHAAVCRAISAALGGAVSKVVVSKRLVTSPCVLVTDDYGWTSNMERIMRSQALRDSDDTMAKYMIGKRTLEVNPEHPIIRSIAARDPASPTTRSTVQFMFQAAKLGSGFVLDEPVEFATRVFRIMAAGMEGEDVDADAPEANTGGASGDEAMEEDAIDLQELD